MSEPLTHELFRPHLGHRFRFGGRSELLKLEKIDVKEQPPLPGLTYKAFTLIFTGPREQVLPEGFYAAEAEGGTRFDFYIMPIHTPARDRQDYQAIFN
jgi:hypothetical protein